MKKTWKKLSSKIVHKNAWYFVRQDAVMRPDGFLGQYNVVVNKPSVYIVAVNNKQEIIFIYLYRYPTKMWSWEVPAGRSDGQKPLFAAKKELKEETGYIARQWELLGKIQIANGLLDEMGYVFLATDLLQTSEHQQNEEGIKKIMWISFTKAWRMVSAGDITDSQSIVALTLVALKFNVIR